MKMKQNQTFFHGTYLSLTAFFIGHKILKYFNDIYNWHLSISKTITNKSNGIKRDMCKSHVQNVSWYTI